MKYLNINRLLLIICISAAGTVHTSAQSSVDEILKQIESNNPTLKAAAAQAEAQRLENRSGALPENPEFEFNYLWGADGIGNRRDFSVTQAFDVATLTGMKSRQVAGQNELAALSYKSERLNVLLEAKQACIDLIYYNALKSELDTHLEQALTLVSSFEKRIQAGDASILDLNKAKVHLTTVRGQISQVDVEREALLSTLKSLNGGRGIVLEERSYALDENLPADFEAWYTEASEKNPVLQYVRQEVAVDERQLSIDKTAWVPELTVGYMSELTTADKFRGVTVGVNIPLWSNSNKVKQSRAKIVASQSRKAAAEQQFYFDLLSMYNRAASLKANSELMRASLGETDSRDYLLSAQSKGEISMIEYLVETDQYYEALEQTLSAERDYHQALAQLNAVEL
ncbi:MAG: TolC family protein [Bacteroidales bacterium]